MASRISAFDFYLLRVPRLSSGVVHKINGFEKKEEAWNSIMNLFDDNEILDAIYLASDNFFEELTGIIKEGYTPSADKILETLYKYISRMSSRPTPYGKFSGVSVGGICESMNSIELSGEFLSSYRFDMGFTAELSRLVTENHETQKQLVYFTNSTLYENADYFKYIDFSEIGNKRSYQWAKVVNNPLLKHILDLAKKGKHFQKLVDALKNIGISDKKAEQYVHKLIGIKLLISELEPRVTAADSNDTISRLKTVQHKDLPISTLLSLERCLQTINTNSKKVKSFTVRKVCEDINVPTSKNLFQVDMRIGTTSNRISKRTIEELTREVEELSVINRAKIPNDLLSFRRKFLARYGDRQVPLLEAIDHESGIGYGEVAIGIAEDNPLIQGLGKLWDKQSHDHRYKVIQSLIDKHKLDVIDPTTSIELDYQDIQAMQMESSDHSTENLPLSFYLLGNLLLPKNLEDKKSYQFNLIAGGGVSSIPLMTRFAHLDNNLEEKLQDCVAWEEKHAHNIVFAEVVYMPESRVGNILTRPKLFKYEIPVIGQCSVDDDFRISLDDLWISVKEGKIILRSKRLNKQIIPRLSSAHNFHYGMVAYRFLCDLQFQSDYLDLSWDWGILSKRSFLPRVSYKHIILSRARWNIAKTSLQALGDSDDRSKTLCLKEKFGLPDLVLLANGDNELLLDLRSPIGSEIVLKELRKRDLVLHEYLFEQYESPVCDSAGKRYNNEILIPLKVDKLVKGIKFTPIGLESVRRSFHPGSEWAFIKIYCGIGESDRILSEHILQLKNELAKEELIEKWFFIRYHDPEPHIRLRFLLRKKDGIIHFQKVVDRINKHLEPLLKNNIVFRIVYDTYERELQRYGEDNIEICESIFHIDSESVLSLFPLFKQGEGNHLRWLTGMLGVDYLFTAFGLDIDKRINFLAGLRDAFLCEFSGYDKLKYKLDCKYREHRKLIQHFFDPPDNNDMVIYNILFDRFQAIRSVAEPIKNTHLSDHSFFDLLSSLSHMYVNRLFTSKQREHEMIIYHFLIKHYSGIAKRNNAGHATSNSIHDNLSI